MNTRCWNCTTITAVAIALLLAIRTGHSAERPAMTWGEVPREHLQMTSFPADSNANAVILFDYGEGSFSSQYDLTFTRHTRIKILTKAGFDRGTVAVSYFAGKDGERITDIEGITTTLGADGEPVQTELDEDEIFTEEVTGDWRRVRFTLPALAEGCVIEFRYSRTGGGPMDLPDWDFQTTEPVLWSEYHVVSPVVFQFAVVSFGAEPYAINDVHYDTRPFLSSGNSQMMKMQILHYARSDVPALRSEPYITTLDDYRLKLNVQLAAVQWPGETMIKVLQTWPALLEELLKPKALGGALEGTGRTRDLALELTAHCADPKEKLTAIYDHIRQTIVWDGGRSYGVHHDLNDVLTVKKGNSAEINVLLIAMLRAAGLEATPVLLSTRSHGKIQKLWPIYTNFDYLIAQVRAGGETFLVDATERQRPLNVLPTRALNHEGLLVKEGTETWIPIAPGGDSQEAVFVTATLTADGSIAGSARKSFSGNSALDARSSLSGKKDDEYVKGLLRTETTGFAQDSFSIENRDSSDRPLDVRMTFNSATAGQVLEDRIFLNPMLFERRMSSPFKLATRTFPVDIPYGSTSTYTITLAIPPGYTVTSVPVEFSTPLPGNGGRYSRSVAVKGDTISLVTRFEITRTYFEPRSYKDLRKVFDESVTREAELIVLTKVPPPPPAPPKGASTPKTRKK
ncbi:MAG: DUF3857 domain-containing protein [Ignavibacteriae bacterium]|nr:DUF3857 domain-containing protein [Ignavibacteriota bacterium]